MSNCGFYFSVLDGERELLPVNKSIAGFCEGAGGAIGFGGALQGSKLHQRLIKNVGRGISHQLPGFFKKYFFGFWGRDVIGYAKQAGQYPKNISIHHRYGFFGHYRGDGGGCIAPNSGKLEQFFKGCGEQLAVIMNNFCTFVNISCAAVVAKSLPNVKYFIFRGLRESGNSRKALDELFVIWKTLIDTCLLQDYFRNPNFVRVIGASPRQIALVLVVPYYYLLSEY